MAQLTASIKSSAAYVALKKISWMRQLVQRTRRAFNKRKLRASPENLWKKNLEEEVNSWLPWIEKRGDKSPEQFRDAINPSLPLQQDLRNHIHSRRGSGIKILDVGAGPLTLVGKSCPDYSITITPVDPLAETYNKYLEANDIAAPIPTIKAIAENLTATFDENSFDLVYSRNAIDHCYDPAQAIREMVSVLKPGCYVILRHLRNEGFNEQYMGLHQWDFRIEDDKFLISRPHQTEVDINEQLSEIADVSCRQQDEWLDVYIRKKP